MFPLQSRPAQKRKAGQPFPAKDQRLVSFEAGGKPDEPHSLNFFAFRKNEVKAQIVRVDQLVYFVDDKLLDHVLRRLISFC